jgi:hypothetical protein
MARTSPVGHVEMTMFICLQHAAQQKPASLCILVDVTSLRLSSIFGCARPVLITGREQMLNHRQPRDDGGSPNARHVLYVHE